MTVDEAWTELMTADRPLYPQFSDAAVIYREELESYMTMYAATIPETPSVGHEWIGLPQSRFTCNHCGEYIFDPKGNPGLYAAKVCPGWAKPAVDINSPESRHWQREDGAIIPYPSGLTRADWQAIGAASVQRSAHLEDD